MEILGFFWALYTDDSGVGNRAPIIDCFPLVEVASSAHLVSPVTVSEVHKALFDITPLKTLGIDGLHP